jgi:RES domain
LRRRIGSTRLNENLLFADFTDPETFTVLREVLASWLVQFKLKDFDLSAITSQYRRLTQEAARYVYELAHSGHTVFAGIRYPSRLTSHWELWAIFHDRMLHTSEEAIETIREDDPDLMKAATRLGLKIG